MRRADRWIGVPALAALGITRPLFRRQISPPATIGLLKTAAIGDTVLMTGVISDLRRAFPESSIVLFAGPSNSPIAPLIAGLSRTISISPTSPASAVRAIREAAPDVLLDFGSWPRIDALLAALSGASRVIGFSSPGQHRHYAFDVVVPHTRAKHEIDNYRSIVRPLGIESTSLPSLSIPSSAALPEALAGELARPSLIFHTCSGGVRRELKEWPIERWIELGRLAGPRFQVLFTGSPADRAVIEQIAPLIPGSLDLSGRLSLAQTALLIHRSACVVSVNTGVAHISAALQAPTVVLDGATTPARWGALGPRVVSISTPPPAGGFLHLGWETPDSAKGERADCMMLIEPLKVWEAVETLTAPAPIQLGDLPCRPQAQ